MAVPWSVWGVDGAKSTRITFPYMASNDCPWGIVNKAIWCFQDVHIVHMCSCNMSRTTDTAFQVPSTVACHLESPPYPIHYSPPTRPLRSRRRTVAKRVALPDPSGRHLCFGGARSLRPTTVPWSWCLYGDWFPMVSLYGYTRRVNHGKSCSYLVFCFGFSSKSKSAFENSLGSMQMRASRSLDRPGDRQNQVHRFILVWKRPIRADGVVGTVKLFS